MRKGFSLVEMLVVMSIIAIIFAMSSMTIQSLNLTSEIIKQNKQYEAISQIYNYLIHIENAIVIKNDYSNNQFLYQLPLLVNKKLADPIQGGNWYAIKLRNGQLIKINQQDKSEIQISPKDVSVQLITFDFDYFNKQLRITMDLCPVNNINKNTRANIVVNMLNILNEI